MTGFGEYENYDALGLADLIRRGEISAPEVLDAAIERVDARDPALNAVVHKMHDTARASIDAGLPPGPLSGVPYMLKDLYVLYTGAPTTNGSRLFADFVADHDSTLTERLRAAGLVIMGKTNSPEFGYNFFTEPVLHGATRNPWNTERSPGGSSGGAAAAVAAGMLPAAHATDGGGSIRIPASNCGLFGLKPTRARNPSGPDVGEGWSGMGVGHAVTRSVRDSAALLDVTHGPAPGDPYCAPPPARPFSDEVGADPGRLRIGLITAAPSGHDVDPVCVAGAEATAKLCEDLGHHVEPATIDVDIAAVNEAVKVIIGGNMRHVIDTRCGALGRAPREDDVERATWYLAEEARNFSAADYARAIQVLHATGRRMGGFFANYDLLLSPTLANPPLPLGTVDMMAEPEGYFDQLFRRLPFTPLFNITGQPACSLPLHWTDDGLPVGVQLGADFGNESLLLRVASQIEQARPWFDRRPPLL